VALVVPASAGFPDNWIYIHETGVRVGRVQNFGSWSPQLVKDGFTCLGLEYFVSEGDDLWESSDDDLVALGMRELVRLGLVGDGQFEAGYVVRVPKAYPVYDEGYAERVDVLRGWLSATVPNVHPVGRNGMHRYNNQDHSMLTAMLTVDNIVTVRDPRRVDGQRRGGLPRDGVRHQRGDRLPRERFLRQQALVHRRLPDRPRRADPAGPRAGGERGLTAVAERPLAPARPRS
jgi:hypothetical protein